MVHHIFATDASSKDILDGPAFLGVNPGAAGDSLIVDEDAYLITRNSGAGASLTGIWTVTINGTVGTVAFDVGLDIEAALATDVSHVTIGKTGSVFGDKGIIFAEGGSLTNKGFISGRFPISGGTSTANFSISNSGFIQGGQGCISHGGDVKVTNSGTIIGGEQSSINASGDLSVNNSGFIQCFSFSGFSAGGVLTLLNTGTISSDLGDGQLRTIHMNGEAHITNTGTFVGNILLESSADVFTNFKKVGTIIKDGIVTGTIDLGGGADHFNGGAKHETVRDGDGTDIINLGGGNDTFIAIKTAGLDSSDSDVVNGGKGINTYDASEATGTVVVNLDTIAYVNPNNPDAGPALGLTASGADLSTDHITGFENATGGAGADVLVGSNGANTLIGNAGADTLVGLGGRDVMTGGANADIFQFLKLTDSGMTSATRDLITDFGQGEDTIDLSAIDANGSAAGDTAFNFIGVAHFSGTRGELRQGFSNGNTIISGDVNGDGSADFSIVLKGGLFLLSGTSDFVL